MKTKLLTVRYLPNEEVIEHSVTSWCGRYCTVVIHLTPPTSQVLELMKIKFYRENTITMIQLNLKYYSCLTIQSPMNPSPAEPGHTLPLQTVQIQISWLLAN